MEEKRKRYIGLDVHKHYLIALGVDADLNVVLPARRVDLFRLESWMKKTLTKQDEVVLEMTTNTWQLYDELIQYARKVTVVHPPHVTLITRSQVMNDKIAASILARLLAKGLLVGIWIPPQEIREARGLVAQRQKMVRLATQAKNRLHAVIQRHHLIPPAGNPFGTSNQAWWQMLPLGKLEKLNLQSDLETLQFAAKQVKNMTEIMEGIAVEQEEIGRLLHLAGFGMVIAFTVWASHRRYPPLCGGEIPGGLCRVGNTRPRQRDDQSEREDHKDGEAGPAHGVDRSRQRGCQLASALESGTGKTGTPPGTQQSGRSHRTQIVDRGLVCAARQDRQIC